MMCLGLRQLRLGGAKFSREMFVGNRVARKLWKRTPLWVVPLLGRSFECVINGQMAKACNRKEYTPPIPSLPQRNQQRVRPGV